jgi:ATP-dependent protease HslVU (ClpYQ) peptidase subunit
MTCIVGLIDGKSVIVGGDSAGVEGYLTEARMDAKVFRNGPFLLGFTSSFRMGQLLRFKLNPPQPAVGQDVFEFMATTFVDAVRECLKAGGFARKENEVESGGRFLVGYTGRLFLIDSDYQVGEPLDGYTAVGCGNELALGALFATDGLPADERVLLALQAAARYSTGVRAPFEILRW